MECAEKETRTYAQLSGDSLSLKVFQLRQDQLAGKTAEARKQLRVLLRSRAGAGLVPYQKAQLCFAAGETEAGYAELETAYREHSWWLVTMMVDPGFDAVRSEPRFVAMEKRVGLPVGAAAPLH
jgi:hypothetical protein